MKRALGYKRDSLDKRDRFAASPRAAVPAWIDLRKNMPAVRDQGNIGACIGFGITSVLAYRAKVQGLSTSARSPMFEYYVMRELEGNLGYDSGGTIRGGVKALNLNGACPEANWPYKEEKYNQRPSAKAFELGFRTKTVTYERVNQSLSALKAQLAAGNPIIYGQNVYEAFNYIGADGVMPLPKWNEAPEGGHCMVLCGYWDSKRLFVAQNSWGKEFGDKGYVYIPYEFITDEYECSDFWVIRAIPGVSVGRKKQLARESGKK